MVLLLVGTIGLTNVLHAQSLWGTNYCGDGVLHAELWEACDDGNFDNDDGCSSNCEIETVASTQNAVDPSFVNYRGKLLMPVGGENQVYTEKDGSAGPVKIDPRPLPTNNAQIGDTSAWPATVGVPVQQPSRTVTSGQHLWTPDTIVNVWWGIQKSVISHDRTLPVWTIKSNGKEVCDDGDENGIVCDPGYGGKCYYCSEACELEEVVWSICGDGNVDPQFEECDDGNYTNWDGCSASCTKEEIVKVQLPAPTKLPTPVQKVKVVAPVKKIVVQEVPKVDIKETPKIIAPLELPLVYAVCGDSVIQVWEECDDGNYMSGDGCNSTCMKEVRDMPVVTKIMVEKAKTRVQRSPKKSVEGIGVTQPYPQQLSETGAWFFVSSFSVFLFVFMMMWGGVLVMREE